MSNAPDQWGSEEGCDYPLIRALADTHARVLYDIGGKLREALGNVGVVVIGTAVQIGFGVLALVKGFGVTPTSWPWILGGFLGVVFGRVVVRTVVRGA